MLGTAINNINIMMETAITISINVNACRLRRMIGECSSRVRNHNRSSAAAPGDSADRLEQLKRAAAVLLDRAMTEVATQRENQ
jgi:hypothetical protein